MREPAARGGESRKANPVSEARGTGAQPAAGFQGPLNPLWFSLATQLPRQPPAGDDPDPPSSPGPEPRPPPSLVVQAKLTVGAPGDPYEQEADRAAAAVTSGRAAPPVSGMGEGVSPSTGGGRADGLTSRISPPGAATPLGAS